MQAKDTDTMTLRSRLSTPEVLPRRESVAAHLPAPASNFNPSPIALADPPAAASSAASADAPIQTASQVTVPCDSLVLTVERASPGSARTCTSQPGFGCLASSVPADVH